MNFLNQCVQKLEDGVDGKVVVQEMREYYNTVGSLRVQVDRARTMYNGPESEDFVAELQKIRQESSDDVLFQIDNVRMPRISDGINLRHVTCPHLRQKMERLPSRLPQHVRNLRVTVDELKECKRLTYASRRQMAKDRMFVHGRTLLACARETLHRENVRMYDLMLALMLLTGRRMAEICNGMSKLETLSTHHCRFEGQIKRRNPSPYTIPVLYDATIVQNSLHKLRVLQGTIPATNKQVSARYASSLNQHLKKHAVYSEVGHVHNLRKIYTCLSLLLFDWGALGPMYVAMEILGQGDVDEPIVYSNVDVGDLGEEVRLGPGVIEESNLPS